MVFFLSLLSHNFDDRLSSNFHKFVILCICWDTPSEKTGLWQLPIVSSVFKLYFLRLSRQLQRHMIRGKLWGSYVRCLAQCYQGLLIWRLLCKALPRTIWHSNCLYSLRNSNVSTLWPSKSLYWTRHYSNLNSQETYWEVRCSLDYIWIFHLTSTVNIYIFYHH